MIGGEVKNKSSPLDNWKLHWLEAAGDLEPWRSQIARQVRTAHKALVPFVRPEPLDILVEGGREGVTPETGIGVRVSRPTLAVLTVDPDNENFTNSLLNGCLQRQLIRLSHMAMRAAGPGYGFTLGGALVSEGLAGQFVRLVLASKPEIWETAVSDAELDRQWPQHRELMTPKYDHAAWFSGSASKPRWLGYSLGCKLVEHWLVSGAQITPKRMIDVPAPKVLTVAMVQSLVS